MLQTITALEAFSPAPGAGRLPDLQYERATKRRPQTTRRFNQCKHRICTNSVQCLHVAAHEFLVVTVLLRSSMYESVGD